MNKVALSVLNSIGLSTENCTSLSLHFDVSGEIEARATYFVPGNVENSFVESIKKFKYVEKDPS